MKMLTERQLQTVISNSVDEPGIVATVGRLIAIVSEEIPLDADEVFTSQQHLCSQYRYLIGTCVSDVAGTLICEFSNDGTNYDGQILRALEADERLAFNIRRCGHFFRVRYVNGSIDQSYFRLYVNGE